MSIILQYVYRAWAFGLSRRVECVARSPRPHALSCRLQLGSYARDGAAAAMMIGWTTVAYGQALSEYANPLVQGLDTQPGVTVLSRLHPDYDPTGFHVGLVTILPSLDQSIGYDDNVTGTTTNHGSVRLDTTGKITAKAPIDEGAIATNFTIENAAFLELQDQNYTNWNSGISATHDFGDDQLGIGATHDNENQTSRDIDLPELDKPISYRLDDLRLNYTVTRGHIQIQPVMDVQFYGFDNGSVLGVPYQQSYRDRVVYMPSVAAVYEFANRRRLILVLRDANAFYANGPYGQPKENFDDISALAGVAYDLDGVIGLRLLVGYEERDFSSRSYKTIRAPIVEGLVSWTPDGLTTLTGKVARLIEDSAADGTTAYTVSRLHVQLDHELYRNVIFSLGVGVDQSQYSQNQGGEYLFQGNAQATWQLNRSLRLDFNYRFSTRRRAGGLATDRSSSAIETLSQNYSDNVFRVGIHLAI